MTLDIGRVLRVVHACCMCGRVLRVLYACCMCGRVLACVSHVAAAQTWEEFRIAAPALNLFYYSLGVSAGARVAAWVGACVRAYARVDA